MNQKLTPWYPGHIKPARPGVYQQLSGFRKSVGYQFWDGVSWYSWEATPEKAAESKCKVAISWQSDKWRGLAAPQKGQAS